MENETQHTINLINRESLSATGVKDVDTFNEQEISAVWDNCKLVIKGDKLHIDQLSTDTGVLNVTGRISSLSYVEKVTSNSLIKRLFGG